jgi:hypothetical protein
MFGADWGRWVAAFFTGLKKCGDPARLAMIFWIPSLASKKRVILSL